MHGTVIITTTIIDDHDHDRGRHHPPPGHNRTARRSGRRRTCADGATHEPARDPGAAISTSSRRLRRGLCRRAGSDELFAPRRHSVQSPRTRRRALHLLRCRDRGGHRCRRRDAADRRRRRCATIRCRRLSSRGGAGCPSLITTAPASFASISRKRGRCGRRRTASRSCSRRKRDRAVAISQHTNLIPRACKSFREEARLRLSPQAGRGPPDLGSTRGPFFGAQAGNTRLAEAASLRSRRG